MLLGPLAGAAGLLAAISAFEHHPLQRSGLIELGPAELAAQLGWP